MENVLIIPVTSKAVKTDTFTGSDDTLKTENSIPELSQIISKMVRQILQL